MPDLLVICPTTAEMQDRLSAHFDPLYPNVPGQAPPGLADTGATIRYVLTDGHYGIPKGILDMLPNLRAVSCYGVGYDGVDTQATNARGIPVSHTPGVLDEEVATTALMLFIAMWRNLEAEMAQARSGAWQEQGNLPLSRSCDGQTIGIFGLGRIGKALAGKLAPFNATILYHGRSRQDVAYEYCADLAEMARRSDTLISIAPGGATTRHMIDAKVLSALGPDGGLVNVGRGSVVDEAALIDALQAGTLGRAALDVFEDEPHIPRALREMGNVVLTPHIGSATVETRRAMGNLAIDNLVSHKEGRGLMTPVPESAGLT